MRKKQVLALLGTAALVCSLAGCKGKVPEETTKTESNAGTQTKEEAEENPNASGDPVKVGIILSTGGLGDKNFNDMSYAGLLRAQEDFGIEFDYVEPKSVSDFLPNFQMFAETEEYDLIIGLAQDQTDAVLEISEAFPEQKITHIDAQTDAPNVRSIVTKWQEQTFLTGVIAGLCTKDYGLPYSNEDNVVGCILGVEAANLKEGVVGFEAGVRYVNPDCQVLTATVGSFADPGKGKEIALSMYNKGADFIQHIAGSSGLGVFNAAKESGRYAFGVGGNQNDNEPDYIPATALRNVDEMVYKEVEAVVNNTWEPGIYISGIKEGAVGYDIANSNVELGPEVLEIVEEIKGRIISGELVPCNTEEELDAWVAENQYFK